MGRWSYSNRLTVEECKSFPTKFLNRHKYFDDSVRSGWLNWSRNGEKTGSIGFTVSTLEGDEYIRLFYTHTSHSTDEKTELDYKIRLESTTCNFGGKRWWFKCPLVKNGHLCGRRVGVLYLGGGKYFGCRHCYDLTYQSSQESHKFDSLFRKIGIAPKDASKYFG